MMPVRDAAPIVGEILAEGDVLEVTSHPEDITPTDEVLSEDEGEYRVIERPDTQTASSVKVKQATCSRNAREAECR